MKNRVRIITICSSFLVLWFCYIVNVYAKPRIQFPAPDKVQASKKEVREIEVFYDKLEDTLNRENLDALMTFYSDDYLHMGVDKDHLRALWSEIFSNFDNLFSIHIFSKIKVRGKEAVITCTGVLMGVPKGSKAGEHDIIDRWITEKHWLSKRAGHWQIVGGGTHWYTGKSRMPGEKFELKFHPFF